MEELVLAILTSVASLSLGTRVLKTRAEEQGCAVIPCRPSSWLLAITTIRYVFGGWLVVILGFLLGVPGGEYRQYIVTYEQGLFSLIVWNIGLCTATVAYRIVGLLFSQKQLSAKSTLSKEWIDREASIEQLRWVFFFSLALKLGYVIVSSWLGSEDRGHMYTYWALVEWKPTAVLIAVNRLLDLCYVLAPVVIVRERKYVRSICYALMVGVSIGLMGLWGDRGEVLYPIVYMGIGAMAVVERKTLLKLAIVITAICAVSLPTMSALRDMPEYGEMEGFERITLLARVFEKESSFKKRVQTIGRDVYACSDGFVYEQRMRSAAGIGRGVSIKRVVRHGIPRILGGAGIKSDGSAIAQRYMGSDVEDWYPCITFPADAFRRFRWTGVVFGACTFGLLALIADRVWLALRTKGESTCALLLILMPVTLLRSAPTGTLKEVIGIYPWEILKYAVLCACIGWLIDKVSKRLN